MAAKRKAKLSIVKPNQSELRINKDWDKERETWRITRQEAAVRVRSLRTELQSYRDQIDAVPFDILADSIPRCLDHSKRKWAINVMEEFNPLIKRLYDRCDEAGKNIEEMDFNAQLFDLKTEVAETAFSIGVLAGALFAGASSETVDRFERGLLYTIQMNPQLVKGA